MILTPYYIYKGETRRKSYISILALMAALLAVMMLGSCSTTSSLEPGEQLFTGLKPIEYTNYESGSHFNATQEEIEASLATAPNGALFGSSYYRTPFPYALWIYNACNGKENALARWLNGTFGKAPVLMSNVNPELRTSVAQTVLQNHGYFRGNIDYSVIEGKPKTTKNDTIARPRTAKIAYKVDLGPVFRIDTVTFLHFPKKEYEAVAATKSLIKPGNPFDISVLDAERTRIYKYFRNNGYYFYKQSYTTFRADTLKVPEHVRLQIHLADSLPEEAMRKWMVGKIDVKIQRTATEELTDTIKRRILTVHFGGKKPPIRPKVILSDVRLFPGQLFSEESYQESINNFLAKGIYASSAMEFTPRTDTAGHYVSIPDTLVVTRDGKECAGAGILDMSINCVLDKPYDFSIQANYTGKTSGRQGPGVEMGFAKRNAFRGGELLSLNLGASYEFEPDHLFSKDNANYEISGDLSLTIPKLFLPKFLMPKRRLWQTTPSTVITLSRETINRSNYFRRHILSSELTYIFQPTKQSVHKISPIIVEYDRLAHMTDKYLDKVLESPILTASAKDYFITKMRYNYRFTSPMSYRHPIYFSTTLTEASNILALGYLAAGKSWNEKDKVTFKAPFSQFVKAEVDWRKTWSIGDHSSLVAHAQAGVLKVYGNSDSAPYSEYFYVGGANNVRAFSARSIGPGRSHVTDSDLAYLTNVGDMKFVMNLEYRPHLFGSLYGALFIDAGNVWTFNSDVDLKPTGDQQADDLLKSMNGGDFKASKFLNDLAVGIGVGIRYDLDFFVLRLDWGYALHAPYETSKGGYFNIPSFSKAHCLNFAIGYPF